jgi:4-alpha-glucanotransferase
MPTLREWWHADSRITSNFAWQMLGDAFPPAELAGPHASLILRQHLQSPAMWAIFPLQDLLAADDSLRHPDPTVERINVPAIPDHPWRYRMHLPLEKLAAAHDFNEKIARLLQETGRVDPPRTPSRPGNARKHHDLPAPP